MPGKLRLAQRAAEQDPAFAVNVEALTAAQPKDLDASEIDVRLGATWLATEYIQQFMIRDLPDALLPPAHASKCATPLYGGVADRQKCLVGQNIMAAETYGTGRANAYKILEDTLNLRDVRIYDTVEDADGKERSVC